MMMAQHGGGSSYVTDGLQLWLDGEQNTRSGHNASATNWEDLSGNEMDYSHSNGVVINSNNTFYDGTTSSQLITPQKGIDLFGTYSTPCTLEIALYVEGDSVVSEFINCGGTYADLVSHKFLGLDGGTMLMTSGQNNATSTDTRFSMQNAKGLHLWQVVYGSTTRAWCDGVELQSVSGRNRYGCGGENANVVWRIGKTLQLQGAVNPNPTNIYCIRAYNKALDIQQLNNNLTIDSERFGIVIGGT
jgi:hypothetical protein